MKTPKELEEIVRQYQNGENITDMSRMFHGCKSLKNLNLSNFNTEKVIFRKL